VPGELNVALKPVMLAILDGWGWREESADNAVRLAHTPHFDRLWESCPRSFLATSGLDVGLPDGQMGNSEVGHLNLGAGRVVLQDLVRITKAIEDGTLAGAVTASGLPAALKASGGTCHLMGLVSPGGVHSHQDHAVALARVLQQSGVPTVIHAFTDGRDTPPEAAAGYLAEIDAALPPGVDIATVTGRYWAMDRDQRWERVQQAYDAIVTGRGQNSATAQEAVDAAYANSFTDEFVPASVIGKFGGIKDGDAVLCFNFRADRVKQLMAALLLPDFDGFTRQAPQLSAAVSMTHYGDEFDPWLKPLLAPQTIANGLGETVALGGSRQLRLAESEKYPHVTYFFNGGKEEPFVGEERTIVDSPKVATHDLQPEMSAPMVGDRAVEAIGSKRYDLIIVNFANPDMVGHTGNLEAAIAAVEAVDLQLGRIAEAIHSANGVLMVTADHGNCEQMRDPLTGGPHTAHTTNPVPAILYNTTHRSLRSGRLADVAPTLIQLMDLKKPQEMSGTSLLA
jgi:2,3-bisphosphoglycerate-independent phosphoglycerate mutase